MKRALLPLLLFVLAGSGFAQDAPAKRALKPEGYKVWESLRSPTISADGRWFATGVSLVDGDPRVELRSVDGPEKAQIPGATSAEFSDDSRWVAYLAAPPKQVADKLREQKQPVENKLGLRDLQSGEERVFDSVQRFAFTKGGKFLLAHRYRPPTRKEGGSDLLVISLEDGREASFGFVSGFAANEKGTLVALGIDSDSGYHGLQLLNLASLSVANLHWSKDNVSPARWAKDVDTLAFLVGKDDEKKEGAWNTLVVAANLESGKPHITPWDPKGKEGFPEGMRLSEDAPLNLSDDGTRVFFGIRAWEDKKKPEGKPEDRPGVEVWHWKDLDIVPLRKRRQGMESRRTHLATWTPEFGFQRVADDSARAASVLPSFTHALVWDDLRYKSSVTNGLDYSDYYLHDFATGKREKVLEKTQWGMIPSPKGRYLTYYADAQWWIFDTRDGSRTCLTRGLRDAFDDVEDDHTVPERPPGSRPDWLADDAGVLLYSRYGVYLWREGRPVAERILDGVPEHLVFRLLDLDRSDEERPSLSGPLYFSAFDDVDKGSGVYRFAENATDGKMIVFETAASIGGLAKAEQADRLIFTLGSFERSPNVFVTNGVFTQAKPMTATNPQQKEFFWGKTELVKYKSRWGKELQGTLIYPAEYVEGRQYPMVVYIYERLSNGKNSYIAPNEASAYNPQVFSQNGYFVYMPDIAYRDNVPGQSAAECLEPAVAAALRLGVGVNPDKIGLMGHSWGAYQTAYLLSTGTKTFAAGVAGAPLTELISMYLSVYWNSGTPDQEIFETSQGRLGVPFWEDPKAYMDNSAVWNAKNFRAPILVTFGDEDGAVDWHQGLYLYNTMRRMGKEIIMLVYAGENHGLAKRPNQLDYARRVRHFFDVHLKGITPEPWITRGEPVMGGGL